MAKKKIAKKKPPVPKTEWEKKLYAKMVPYHQRTAYTKMKKLLRRLTTLRSSMTLRSAKYNVACTITVEELRQMAYDAYGKPCPYSKRVLTVDTMVFDHIMPISKGGPSTRENLQVISRFSNTIKGSLEEQDFLILLDWLDHLPDHIRCDVMVRLAGGKR
jgi:5-methylcytosine-specific restriction endonuclease McrA